MSKHSQSSQIKSDDRERNQKTSKTYVPLHRCIYCCCFRFTVKMVLFSFSYDQQVDTTTYDTMIMSNSCLAAHVSGCCYCDEINFDHSSKREKNTQQHSQKKKREEKKNLKHHKTWFEYYGWFGNRKYCKMGVFFLSCQFF